MRRWLPRLASRHTTAGTLSVIVQSTTQNGLRLHMVNTGGHSILVAEGKTGIAMTVLPQRSEAATPATGQQAGQ